MMAGYGIPLTVAGSRPFNNILQRPVMLLHIKIGSGEIIDMMAEILGNGKGLQKNLRQDDGTADIEVDTAVAQFD